ncbi:MAG: metallophosphoesterase [Clostridia bacterium]
MSKSTKTSKKTRQIIIGVTAALLAAVIVVVGVLFFPRMGKKHVQIWSADQDFDLGAIQTVEKDPNQPFKILLIADTQLWTLVGDNNRALDQVRELVERTQPDLIATLGDNVSGVTAGFLLKDFIDVMDSFGIPWTAVFGNHDNEVPTNSLNWQGDQLEAAANCLFQKGPSNLYGCGNYAINITENGGPVQTLFMMDNGRYIEYDDGSKEEIYMGYEQIAWYEWNVRGIEQAVGRVVPSMVFTHFAQPEFAEAVEQYGIYDEATGSYTIPEEYGYGKCAYLPSCAPVNSGFFDKCKELGSTKYMFCGHDHENDAAITYEGIDMVYGLKTGPSPKPWNGAEHTGGMVVTIGNRDTGYAVSYEQVVLQ